MKRKSKRSKPRKPQVSVLRESGGKRKKSLSVTRKTPTEFRTGNVTKVMLDEARSKDGYNVQVAMNGRGVPKMIVYTRKDES